MLLRLLRQFLPTVFCATLCCLGALTPAFSQQNDELNTTQNDATPSSADSTINTDIPSDSAAAIGPRREIAIGLVTGLNYNMFSGTVRNALPESSLSVLEGGSGFSGMIGLTIDLLPLKSNGVQFRFAYENKAYSNTTQWRSECFSSENELVPFRAESEHSFALGHLAIAALLRFEVVENFSLLIGPSVQKSIGKTAGEIAFNSLNPHDCAFLPPGFNGENNRSFIESNPDQDFRWGLDAAIAYRRSLAPDWIFSAELGGQYFITYLHRNTDDLPDLSRQRSEGVKRAQINDQILHSFQARLAILYTL